MNKNYLVVSAYSINTPYEEIFKTHLQPSLIQFDIPHKIFPFHNRGTWAKNCQMKAEVILQALNEQPLPVVWLDADAIINKDLIFFNNLNCDISAYYMVTKYNPYELLSGTVYFGNTNITKEIVKKWINLNETNSEWDQRNLQLILEQYKNNPNYRYTPLPLEYIHIKGFENKHQKGIGLPIITHYQASRQNRNKIF